MNLAFEKIPSKSNKVIVIHEFRNAEQMHMKINSTGTIRGRQMRGGNQKLPSGELMESPLILTVTRINGIMCPFSSLLSG